MDRPEGEIKFSELLKNIEFATLPLDHQANLFRLHFCLNFMRKRCVFSWKVSSGYRSIADHTRIYAEINAKNRAWGKPEVRIPWGSFHLIGAAADIWDPNGDVKIWVLENLDILERLDLSCESLEKTSPNMTGTDRWVHFQIFAPKSGKRFFDP